MREEPDIPHKALWASLREHYGFNVARLEFLPLGQDTNAAVYRVLPAESAATFVKVKRGDFYAPGCLVPRYLLDLGIAAVAAPLRTRSGTLWARTGEWTLTAYPYIEGKTGWSDMTDRHWQEAGRIFKEIHAAALPAAGFAGLREEAFDPSPYARGVADIQTAVDHGRSTPAPSGQALCAAWLHHQPTIEALLVFLEELAALLRAVDVPRVICHGDLHPGNLLRTMEGRVFVVDWDDVMLAPRERDFIFVGEPGNGRPASPFFEGYGGAEVDWVAVAYYRYERVVQDIIEYARSVLFRQDLGEETRAAAVKGFIASLEGRNFYAAQLAAARLPVGLAVPARHLSS